MLSRHSPRRSLAGTRRALGIRFEDRRPSRHSLHRTGGYRTHVYRDRDRKLHHRSVDPDFRFAVFYGSGRSRRARWVYPYHHRKYVFVSLNGFWPRRRCPRRYYWYGWHPYRWYGYNPVPYVIHNHTSINVFYTYNYDRLDDYHACDDGITIDAYGPATQTEADIYFRKGVEEFADEDYDDAARYFYTAMRLDTEDPVIPYAYVQALFADEEYRRAAAALRDAVAYLDPEDNGVFFPRGLYPDDEELFDQIEDIEEEVEDEYRDMDARLLLGYQLLGIGEREIAREVLLSARHDLVNGRAADKLLRLIDVIG